MADEQSHAPDCELEKEEWSGTVEGAPTRVKVFAPSKWSPDDLSPFSTTWTWEGVGDYEARHSVGDRDWADDALTIDGETVLEGDVPKREAALELKAWGEKRILNEFVEVIEDDRLSKVYFDREEGEQRPQTPTVEVPADLFAELAANAGRPDRVPSTSTMTEAREVLQEASADE